MNVLNPMLSLELPEPWQLASDADIATYRSGFYAQYFPDGAIVVNSTQGHVIVFIGAGRDVETLFFAMVEDSLLP